MGMTVRKQQFKPSPKKRFAIGAEVRVKLPGVNGIVTQLDTAPTVMGEYWHTVRTEHGDRREPGSNLELVPVPATNARPKESPASMTDTKLLSPDQAIPLLRTRLGEAVENLRHDDPDVDAWERVTLKIVERTFGEHSRNANHFATTVSYARQTDEEAQAWHIENIKSKKGLLHSFIKELEIIPPQRPQVDVTREGVFFAGQTFDALSLASRIFATAKARLLLIDGYIGADTLNILPTTGIQIDILTKTPISPQIKTLCQAFKTQHGSLTVKTSLGFHDRFVVIDNTAVYHFGASIKDLGKKTFMFSLIEEPDILTTLLAKLGAEWGSAAVEV
ncbi:MAG: hypothetical protein WBW84_16425 [Acidobacteriaceae bacterium]